MANARDSTEVERVAVVVLYDSVTGHIVHGHYCAVDAGAELPSREELEREAMEHFTRHAPKWKRLRPERLSFLHVDPAAFKTERSYKIEPRKRVLVEIRRPKLLVHKVPFEEEAQPERDIVPLGKGELPDPSLPDETLRREEATFGTARPPRVDPPSWFLELGRRRAAPAEVLRVLLERLADVTDLREAQLVVNEVGRGEGAGEVIRELITPDIITGLRARR